MTTTNGSNSAPVKQAIKEACYEFGKQEGYGGTARQRFCDWITARSGEGEATIETAAEHWADFATGAYEAGEGEVKKADDAQIEQRAADLKHYITLGSNALIDGSELLDNARNILTRMRANGTAKGTRTWDVMLVWVRKQNASKERALTDPEIEDLFRAQAAKATDELDRLTGVQGVLKKQCSIYEDERTARDEERERAEAGDDAASTDPEDDLPAGIAGIQQALELVTNRLAELGGTRKEQRKAERARVRAAKEAARASARA